MFYLFLFHTARINYLPSYFGRKLITTVLLLRLPRILFNLVARRYYPP